MRAAARELPQPGKATLADLLALPDEGRGHEIIDGQFVEKETSGEHGVAQSRIGRLLGPFDRSPGGRQPGGWWFATEVLIDVGPKQVFRPDVTGWRRERMPERPTGSVITLFPDWTARSSPHRTRPTIPSRRSAFTTGNGCRIIGCWIPSERR